MQLSTSSTPEVETALAEFEAVLPGIDSASTIHLRASGCCG
jgi:hypothetical protein